MAKTKNGSEAKDANGAAEQAPAGQIRVVGQFIKDLSFENPMVEKIGKQSTSQPNINLTVNVTSQQRGEELYESTIECTAHATDDNGTVFLMEIQYGGLFGLKNIPNDAIEPLLHVNGASLLFPYLRRLVGDITREGGFPPVLLDPIDFGRLYLEQKKSREEEGQA